MWIVSTSTAFLQYMVAQNRKKSNKMPPAENLEPVMGRRDSTVINLASHNSLWNFDSKVQLKAHACQSMCLEYLSYRFARDKMYTNFDKFLLKHADELYIMK